MKIAQNIFNLMVSSTPAKSISTYHVKVILRVFRWEGFSQILLLALSNSEVVQNILLVFDSFICCLVLICHQIS